MTGLVRCTACRRPVDLTQPHTTLVIQSEEQAGGKIYILRARVLGHWHTDCARTWPNPTEDRA